MDHATDSGTGEGDLAEQCSIAPLIEPNAFVRKPGRHRSCARFARNQLAYHQYPRFIFIFLFCSWKTYLPSIPKIPILVSVSREMYGLVQVTICLIRPSRYTKLPAGYGI